MKILKSLRFLAGAVGLIVALVPLNAALAQDKNSGFLRDYARLQSEDVKGLTVRSWVSPKLAPDMYNAVLIDPLVFYPEPRPSERVSAEALQDILSYANNTLKASIARRFNVVDRAGSGVVRARIALTGVAAKDEGLAPYQYVPLAFVATMASRSATGTPQQAAIVIETEITDSVTGQLLALVVRSGTGERLARVAGAEKKAITLDTVKPLLTELTEDAFERVGRHIKPK